MLIIIKDDETECLEEFFNNKEDFKNYILEKLKNFEEEMTVNNDKETIERIKNELDWVDSEHLEQQSLGCLIKLYVNALEKQIEIYDSGILVYSERGEY